MEPSCLAVFRDELVKMLPHEEDARRLSENAYHFAEFFDAFDIVPPQMPDGGTALMWGHCHHKATGGVEEEQQLLESMGLTVRQPRGGCCGLAGSWGFEKDKHEISLACGEEALLPAVRDADPSTFVVTDGFSCRTQVSDAGTGRQGLHVAQLMRLAREGRSEPAAYVERALASDRPAPPPARRAVRVVAPVLVGAGAVTAVRALVTRRGIR